MCSFPVNAVFMFVLERPTFVFRRIEWILEADLSSFDLKAWLND